MPRIDDDPVLERTPALAPRPEVTPAPEEIAAKVHLMACPHCPPAEIRLTRDAGEPRLRRAPARASSDDLLGTLVTAGTVCSQRRPWTKVQQGAPDNMATAFGSLAEPLGADSAGSEPLGADSAGSELQPALDALVTEMATGLMPVSGSDLADALEWVLRRLTDFFGVDTSFLRRNDLDRDVTVLVAEWPPRGDVPEPDPLGVVPFGIDPVFGATRDLAGPYVIRPSESPDSYQQRIEQGSGIPQVSMAMVPLKGASTTLGVLGFIKFGDRPWHQAEVNALQAIASLVVQIQFRVTAEERLQYQAYHDELTGLPNRRALLEELDRWSEEPDCYKALLFVDLDRFKSMNDYFGHLAGDRILVTVAERLRSGAAPGDYVARLAGDEFVVLAVQGAGDRDAVELADELRALVATPVAINGHQVGRTASVGLSFGGRGGLHGDVLAQADAALHLAKDQGGDRIMVFDDAMRRFAEEQSDTELLLREAIDAGDLLLHFQPEFDLRSGGLLAVEALVRWNHPTRGLLTAAAFIKVAEDTGLVIDLGRWVLREACRQMADWRRRYPPALFTMRVNISPAQLAARDLVGLLGDCLRANGLPGRAICLEVTEHAVMRDIEQSLEVLHEIKALGVTLAIDDFGIGHSSMAQLKALPVDVLKVDQAFVGGLVTDAGDRAIVDATVRLGHAFGLEVVAEGVENAATVQGLLDVGCYRAQGYHLSRPKPPEDLEEVIATCSRLSPQPNGGAGPPAGLGRSRRSRPRADRAPAEPLPAAS